MIVAVVSVSVVQMSADEVVDVVAVRNRWVATTLAVRVTGGVTAALMLGRAGGRVHRSNSERMFFNRPTAERVVQMAVVKIVDVSGVLDCRMAAARPVNVGVVGMQSRHRNLLWLGTIIRGHARVRWK